MQSDGMQSDGLQSDAVKERIKRTRDHIPCASFFFKKLFTFQI